MKFKNFFFTSEDFNMTTINKILPLLLTLMMFGFIIHDTYAFDYGGNKTDLHKSLNTKERIYIPKVSGDWKHIYDPNDKRSPVENHKWYTNDHTFVKGSDGRWHCYGIIGWGTFMKNGKKDDVDPWSREKSFFHISASELNADKWEEHDYALTVERGVERVLWAPHVIKDGKKFVMFYNSGSLFENADKYPSYGSLRKATSTDMFNWERYSLNPLFSDPGHARDSYVMKYNNTYYYYYCRVKSELDLQSCVAVRTSPDLDHWSGARIVHEELPLGYCGGNTESPVVVQYKGKFYLFICYASDYNKTLVYWSDNPLNFPKGNLVTTINAHAIELINAGKEGWYISNTGWDKAGLYFAHLVWE
jgi:hypothetical protein